MGLTEGGTRAQTITGQIGGTSIELSHNGCIWPSTQRQTQEASDSAVSDSTNAAASNKRIAPSLRLAAAGGRPCIGLPRR